MASAPLSLNRRLFIPEMTQESGLASGLTAVKAVLAGFNQTITEEELYPYVQMEGHDLSFASLSDMVEAGGVGAIAQRLPFTPLSLEENLHLPAVFAINAPPYGQRMLVVWNQIGPFLQVMDTVRGRRWLTINQLWSELFGQTQTTNPADYLAWVTSPLVYQQWLKQCQRLDIAPTMLDLLMPSEVEPENWQLWATLDAALRLVTRLVQTQTVIPGTDALHTVQQLMGMKEQARAVIPAFYWTALPSANPQELVWQGLWQLNLLGKPAVEPAPAVAEPTPTAPPFTLASLFSGVQEQFLWSLVQGDGVSTLIFMMLALFISAAGITIEVFLLQGILRLGQQLNDTSQRMLMMAALIIFFMALLSLQMPLRLLGQTYGRRVEARFRMIFLEKMPRLGHRFFQRGRIADLTQQAYNLRSLHNVPDLTLEFFQTTFQLVLTSLGLIWLEPTNTPIILAILALTIGWSYFSQPLLAQQTTRMALTGQPLNRIYLDTLLGLVPVRVHSSERVIRRKHQTALVDWARSSLDYFALATQVQTAGTLVIITLIIALVFNYVWRGGEADSTLLLVFWAVNVPRLGQQVVQSLQEYLQKRTVVNMILRVLTAPDEADVLKPLTVQPPAEANSAGVKIEFKDTSIVVGGQTLVQNINLTIHPGDHIAIVGPSGAGKSTLVSLLLGWQSPAGGEVLVDGLPLQGEYIELLRRQTAWVDPAIHLWNRSLIYNLQYANQTQQNIPLGQTVEMADLFDVLEVLPDGLQTQLGEEGRMLSGGQGQRVRLGRAMMQTGVRLVILDEPFRGLDRDKRRLMLDRAREYWREATLICITHDVGETLDFERILLVENGRIVEDAHPAELSQKENSRYKDLLTAEEELRHSLWQSTNWQRLWLEKGSLRHIQPETKES